MRSIAGRALRRQRVKTLLGVEFDVSKKAAQSGNSSAFVWLKCFARPDSRFIEREGEITRVAAPADRQSALTERRANCFLLYYAYFQEPSILARCIDFSPAGAPIISA